MAVEAAGCRAQERGSGAAALGGIGRFVQAELDRLDRGGGAIAGDQSCAELRETMEPGENRGDAVGLGPSKDMGEVRAGEQGEVRQRAMRVDERREHGVVLRGEFGGAHGNECRGRPRRCQGAMVNGQKLARKRGHRGQISDGNGSEAGGARGSRATALWAARGREVCARAQVRPLMAPVRRARS